VSIRRLKDKMGTIGVPTGELMFTEAEAILIGQAEEGFRYFAEMLNHTRYWNAVGSVGVMRRAFLEAASYAARRRSFGTTLDSFPMVRERLIWLSVDLAATTSLMFHAAAAMDAAEREVDAHAHLRFRTLAPVIKYRAGEQNVDFARAAIETLGGNGYINTFGTPRLLRDAQVNPIWEGTSNICALDLLRAINRDQGHEAVLGDAEGTLAQLHDPAGRRIAEHAQEAIDDARAAIDGLLAQPQARQQQQARRLADVFGDAVALASLAVESSHEAQQGDYRKALLAELFAMRRHTPTDPVRSVIEAFAGVPKLYPALFAESPL
jgi:acyl-CoA dehydrogenase